MSLKVWLPLNGDLRNNGLYDITVTNDGATVDNNGKIGKCYSFNNTHIIIDSTDLQNLFSSNTQPFSIATWIYLNSDETDRVIIFGNWNANPFVNWELAADGKQILSAGGTSNYIARYSSTAVPKTTWTHIACTYDGSATTFYMNGVKTNSVNVVYPIASKLGSNRFYLGSDNRNDATRLKGKLNDFRLYDHVLSPKEVKEIAKGLVVHYPLSREGFGGDNMLRNTNTGATYWYWSGNGGSRTVTATDDGGVKLTAVTAANSGSWSVIQYNDSNFKTILKPSTTYTASLDVYPPISTSTFRFSIRDGNALNNLVAADIDCAIEKDKWNHCKWTFTTKDTLTMSSQIVYITGIPSTVQGYEIFLKNIKVEEGSSDTPWIPNQSDTAYAAMGLNDDVVYDTSGFSYNATKSGTFEYTSDTPKYSVSTKLLTTSSKIRLPEISFAGMANSYTFSWWQYYIGGNTMPWGFSNGNRLNLFHCSPVCWNTGDSANNPFKNGSTTLPPANLQNGWHHIAVTGDGTTTKLYIDGAYFGNATTYKPITGTQIWISGWDSGTSYTFSGGELSDFRIYATCLSASDIQQLYNTPISLANNGTLFANELTEV